MQISVTKNEDRSRSLAIAINSRDLVPAAMLCLILALGACVVRTYWRSYDPRAGWTKLIQFGEVFAPQALPRLKRTAHYIAAGEGWDSEFYAQVALDPSLRDPSFDKALDNPTYRARRIGLPALAFFFGLGKPRYLLQVYALANLGFWFIALSATALLLRPWQGKSLLCLGAGMLGYGTLISLEHAMTDLPATALILVGLALGSWGGYAAFAAAALTRETSVLAALACWTPPRSRRRRDWLRPLALPGLAVVPLAAWVLYVNHRFGALHAAGSGNFDWPLHAMLARFAFRFQAIVAGGISGETRRLGPLGWLYADEGVNEALAIAAIFFQGLFLVLRRNVSSPVWRLGVCYLALCCVLGPAVWDTAQAAARSVLPMTFCFYLLLARERAAWFWPFFLLGSLSVPYAVHEFWTYAELLTPR